MKITKEELNKNNVIKITRNLQMFQFLFSDGVICPEHDLTSFGKCLSALRLYECITNFVSALLRTDVRDFMILHILIKNNIIMIKYSMEQEC